MTINIIQTITNIMDENRKPVSSVVTEAYVLYPAAGKVIKNIKTNRIYTGSINIGSKGKLQDYIEIDIGE